MSEMVQIDQADLDLVKWSILGLAAMGGIIKAVHLVITTTDSMDILVQLALVQLDLVQLGLVQLDLVQLDLVQLALVLDMTLVKTEH